MSTRLYRYVDDAQRFEEAFVKPARLRSALRFDQTRKGEKVEVRRGEGGWKGRTVVGCAAAGKRAAALTLAEATGGHRELARAGAGPERPSRCFARGSRRRRGPRR